MTRLRRPDDWRFTVGVVSGGHFLSHFYLLAFPPLFPLLRAEFGLSNAELGLVVSALSAATLFQLPVGSLVDRVGARRVFVAAVGLAGGGVALVGLAPSYPAILAFALLSGVGQAGFHPADYAMLEAVTDADREGRSFGVHTFSGFAGFAAAPAVVGTVGLAYGWGSALVAVGAVGLLYAGFAALVLRPVHRERVEAGTTADDGRADDPVDGDETGADADAGIREDLGDVLTTPFLVLFALFLVLTMAGKGIHTFTTVLAVEGFGLPETAGNAALTAFFAAGAGGILVGGVLADRYRPRRILVAGLAVTAGLTWLAVGGVLAVGAALLAGLFAAMGFASGLVFPARDRLVSSFSPAGSAGRSFGLVFTGTAVGGLLSPALLGAVIDGTTATLAFVLVGAFYLVSAAIAAAVGTRVVPSAGVPSGVEGD